MHFKKHHGNDKPSIMVCDFPSDIDDLPSEKTLTIEWLKEITTGIRNIRGELSIKPSTHIPAIFKDGSNEDRKRLESVSIYLKELAGLESITWTERKHEDPPSSIFALEDLKILIPLEGLIDAKEEELRLTKKIAKLTQEKEMLNKKLENKSFIANAPEDLVATQKNRYEVLSKELDNLSEQMIEIQKLI